MICLLTCLAAGATPPSEELDVPESFGTAPPDEGITTQRGWWHEVGGPQLATLVDEALEHNPALGRARGTQLAAEGAFWQQRSALSPQLTGDLSISGQNQEANSLQARQFGFDPSAISPGDTGDPSAGQQTDTNDDRLFWSGSALLSAQWQVPWTGENILRTNASRFDKLAADGDADAQALVVTVLVAGAWLDAIAAQERVEIVEEQLEANRTLLDLTETGYTEGLSTATEVLQQRQQLASTRPQLPRARALRDTALLRLNTALGRPPGAEPPALPEELPVLGPPPAMGVPAALLEQRPDVAAAAWRLDAAHKRHLAEIRRFLPTLSLSGSWGRRGVYLYEEQADSDSGEVITAPSYSVGLAVSLPIWTGGLRAGTIKSARGQELASLNTYRETVLAAMQEVESAWVQEQALAEELSATLEQLEVAETSYDEIRNQYAQGLAPYLNVLTALSSLQQAEIAVLSTRRELLGARIDLHDALGGRWTQAVSQSKDAEQP